jgi:hypothetical protein
LLWALNLKQKAPAKAGAGYQQEKGDDQGAKPPL